MKRKMSKVIKRRDFFIKCLRIITIGGLGTMGLVLGSRKDLGNSRDLSTYPFLQCQGCSEAVDCTLVRNQPKEENKNKECPINKMADNNGKR